MGSVDLKKIYMIVIVSIILLLQACSTGETSNSGTDANNEDKVLIVARKSDVTNLDPHFIVDVSTANVLYEKVYETLVIPNDKMEPQPHLATEWKQLDGLTWEFTLRDDVEFHDGTKFNADAVKKTFDRLLDPKTASPQAAKLGMIKEVEVKDDQHVTFHLLKPYAPLLSILASNEGSILNPTILEKDPESLKKDANGTGPFVFEEWKSGQVVKLSKNKNYWGQEPKIAGVEFKVVPEDTTRLGMVENGEAHVMEQIPVNEIQRIEASNSLELYRNEGLGVEFLGFNVQKAPMDNVLLRKAISYALDREAILSGVFNKVGLLSNSTMSSKVFGYSDKLTPAPYDVDKAKELLKEAALPEGIKLTLLTADRAERISLSEVIQSQLKDIGIEVEIQVLEFGSYVEAASNQKGHLFIGSWGNATGDGDYNQYNLFHSNSHGSAGNFQFYSNSTVDQLIEQAREEENSDVRKEIYAKTQQMELDEAIYVPIRSYENLAVYHSSVNGIKLNPIGYLTLTDIEITD
ncbi:glutathione ABC transporter substrate-binding protein [Psychrobacillus sp.]|uniref:glutathione ABC transporter substrate-binding protein n=1 Tax=Psychrobacillus sp. TaxID=1871623 RepID=UPI0028BD8A06|nr:glutathione ABC transporter substrate-binding protein [Psychrobacillus sp.]